MPNLFHGGTPGQVEEFITLLKTSSVKIEQIMSHGQASPPDFWYDQAWDEWVALLQGTAILEFPAQGTVHLVAGDYLLIPAHRQHRVASTSQDAVWLAIHLDPAPNS